MIRERIIKIGKVVGLAMAILIGGSLLLSSCGDGAKTARDADGLDQDQLQLAAVSLQGRWREDDDFLGTDKSDWTASAGVYEIGQDRLLLFTNSHCLGLAELAHSDTVDGRPEVISFGIEVVFHSGKKARVLRFAEIREQGKKDLALLEVDSSGLSEGRDFVLLPYRGEPELKAGDDVCAAGAPLGLRSTLTFGRISAMRTRGMYGEKCRTIQTDTAINPGNSGGPLLREIDGKWFWVGVNTWKVGQKGVEGLAFTICATELLQALPRFRWYTCDKYGAAEACNSIYGKGAYVP